MENLEADVAAIVLAATGGSGISATRVVQSLWSGYGQIVRCTLNQAAVPSVIVKHVRWPDDPNHPRGWASDLSHERKLRSYRVEANWYLDYSRRCPEKCRVPEPLAFEARDDDMIMVLEDLDASGFAERRHEVCEAELDACLSWLANFHATFMHQEPDGLWPTGTYWHLATRPDELEALDDGPLKTSAPAIDRRLNEARFQTLVHGDAKVANFCFSEDGRRAAAVDFQYVGGGCGMKDVAYFFSSCLNEDESEQKVPGYLDRYFRLLSNAVQRTGKSIDMHALEAEWRALYPVAWTDFYRFLQGWSPSHWKIHRYSERLASDVLAALETPQPNEPQDPGQQPSINLSEAPTPQVPE